MSSTLSVNSSVLSPFSQTGSLSMGLPDILQRLPSVTEMQRQLQKAGSLLQDITVQPAPQPSPLSHLQPNTTQSTVTPAAPTVASPLNELPPIQLATTAPVPETTSSALSPSVLPNIILMSGIVSLIVVIGAIVLQSVSLPAMPNLLQGSVVEQDPATQQYEAVWYQE